MPDKPTEIKLVDGQTCRLGGIKKTIRIKSDPDGHTKVFFEDWGTGESRDWFTFDQQ